MLNVKPHLCSLLITEFMYAKKVTQLDNLHILSLQAFLLLHDNFFEDVKFW